MGRGKSQHLSRGVVRTRRRKILLQLRTGHVVGQGEQFSCPCWKRTLQEGGCVVHDGAGQAGLPPARLGGGGGAAGDRLGLEPFARKPSVCAPSKTLLCYLRNLCLRFRNSQLLIQCGELDFCKEAKHSLGVWGRCCADLPGLCSVQTVVFEGIFGFARSSWPELYSCGFKPCVALRALACVPSAVPL